MRFHAVGRMAWVVGIAGSLGGIVPALAQTASPVGQVRAAGPERWDGTLSATQRYVLTRGPLPASGADVRAKAEANARQDALARAGLMRATPGAAMAPATGETNGRRAPTFAGGRTFGGQPDAASSPSDATGTIGPTRYVQLVNRRFSIFNRTSNTPISSGKLDAFLGLAGLNAFDPQVIWDAGTSRFYYMADAIKSASDNRLAFGWSKTAEPNSAADWCKYQYFYGAEFPDYPKLGDSQYFIIGGVNVYGGGGEGSFDRADVVAVAKPAAGTACPDASTLKTFQRKGLTGGGQDVFSPLPGNQIDNDATGYIIARNLSTPSNRLFVYRVTRATSGAAVIDAAGALLTLPNTYAVPPAATQAGLGQRIDTSDTRLQQGVLARNPRRSNAFSFWTQQTVLNAGVSAVRWYEINPVGTPALRTSGLIAASGFFIYNAAISPDRRVDGSTSAFGGSIVVGYTSSSAANGFNPRLLMGSSVNGAAMTFALVKEAAGPYRDFSCTTAGSTCRWGDYSGASPDPRPVVTGTGAVWLTNQYAGSTSTSTATANWRTHIWAAKP